MPAPVFARTGFGGHLRFAIKKTEIPAFAGMTGYSEGGSVKIKLLRTSSTCL